MRWQLLLAGLWPGVWALWACGGALVGAGPWPRRLRALRQQLAAAALLYCVLAVLVVAGHAMGWGSMPSACQPSPNGKICEDE